MLIIVGAALVLPPPCAQTQDRTSLSFEVVSIKPAGFHPGSDTDMRGGLYNAAGVTARSLIKDAYGLTDDQLSGGPDWINSDKYVIQAKIPGAIATEWQAKYDSAKQSEQMREMFRSLLADRFQLHVSHQTEELPVFALIVAKGGPKITPSQDHSRSGNEGHGDANLETNHITGRPISGLIDILSRQPEIQGRKIIDETGLTATYTYTLKWTRQRPPSTNANDEAQPTADAPALEDALENQLGLQLKSTKAPIDTIVITHIEKPTPN